MGRPSSFTPTIAERICALIAEGRSLRKIETVDGLPTATTIMRWLGSEGEQFEVFRAQYARAREVRADARFESLDDVLEDLREKRIDAATARVLMDAIKWQTGREKPKVYGDAVTVKGDKDNPLQFRRAVELSDAELLALAGASKVADA